jgi:uncharacterized OB-fold protein
LDKPLPRANEDSRKYWDGCNAGKLLFQRCNRCGKAQFYARAICRHCHEADLRFEESAGLGSVHSFSLVFRPPSPAFQDDVPYFIVLVDVDEGFRMMSNLPGAEPSKVKIGSRVKVAFEARGEQKIPQFRLVES